MKAITTKIISVESASPRVKLLKVAVPGDFVFLPGQFVMVSVPGHLNKAGVTISKAFSIASSPLDKGFIELCVANIPGGSLSPKLCSLKSCDTITISEPYGKFTLQKPVPENTVFIASGTGIAPLMSMIRSIASTPIRLFYGFRNPEDFLYKDELESYKNLELVASISNGDNDWTEKKGRINTHLDALQPNAAVYICGPPQMVSDTIKVLKDLGFSDHQIHKEQW